MGRFYVLLLGMCCWISGCSIAVGQGPATPSGEDVVFAGATAVDAEGQAGPLATEVMEAGLLLRLGDDFLRDGRLEDAAGIYRTVLGYGASVEGEHRARAAFHLGQAALRDGDYRQALEAFGLLIAEYPENANVAQAYFMRGDANAGMSQWGAAIADYARYLSLRPGLIDSYVYERIADAQMSMGQADAALGNYEKAIDAGRSKVPLLVLREKLAGIYVGMSRAGEAVAQYDAILLVARNSPYRAAIALRAARALLAAGDEAGGMGRLRGIVDDYGETGTAYEALKLLEGSGHALDGWQRGRRAYVAGDYRAAIDGFEAFIRAGGEDAPAELYLLLGRAYRQLGESEAAMGAFDVIVGQYAGDALFGEALLERGRTRFLAGDISGAIRIYLSIAEDYGEMEEAAGEALWRAGYLHGTEGEAGLSREIFIRLAEAYPNHALTVNGLFNAASAAIQEENWSVAEALYGRIAGLAGGDERAAAYLWVGRLAEMRGDDAAAEEALGLAVGAAPDSYFAARAGDMRAGRGAFEGPADYVFDYDVHADARVAEEWLRERFGIEEGGELWRMTEELRGDGHLVRGRELFAIGAYEEASEEFEARLDMARVGGDVLGSYRLAVHLRGLGAYRESIIAAADVIIASGVGTLDAPRFIARMRFPAYYIDLVRREGEARGIDPLLMLSLIRQESLFNTNATAAAGEIGLMQVIPSTAQYIAEELEWPDYAHSDLFRPYAGIAFGAFYIDEQLELFDGNAVAGLAAYNAGPGRAYQWNAIAGGDPDLFMTAITIDSTRKYVQFIYRNYTIYRELYGVE